MLKSEADTKDLLVKAGIRIPTAIRVPANHPIPDVPFPGPWFLKAQVLEGSRAKRGLVVRCQAIDELLTADQRLSERIGPIERLIEAAESFDVERYIAIGVDAAAFAPVLTIGLHGGIEVESVDEERAWVRVPINVARGLLSHDVIAACLDLGLSSEESRSLARVAVSLWAIFTASDTDLLEINPLVWNGSEHVALDGKYRTFDGIADRRVTYFDRDGPVAVFSGGAGVGMAIADSLIGLGTPPANFMDVSGGVTPEAVTEMARLVIARAADQGVKSALLAISASLTPIDGVLETLLEAWPATGIGIPAAGYFSSGAAVSDTSELLRRLANAGVDVHDSLEQAIRSASEAAHR